MTPSERNLDKNSSGYLLLERLKQKKGPVVCIDVLDAMTARLLSKHSANIEGCWISSLGISTRLGIEDVYNISPRDYSQLIRDVKLSAPNKYIIVDADNGGQSHKNTEYAFNIYADLSVALGIVENKRGLKYNSTDKNAGKLHELEDNEVFAEKIIKAKKQNKTLVGIRIENAISNDDNPDRAIDEALKVVEFFHKTSKPDLFIFHWKLESPDIPLRFAVEYNKLFSKDLNRPFLGCIPTTYSKNISNRDLYKGGYDLIIYGNPLLRGQISSIYKVLDSINQNDSLKELDQDLPTVDDVLKLYTN